MGRIENRVSILAGERRLKIADLARRAELGYDVTSRWWHGEITRVDFHILAKLCKGLNCEVGDILTYVNNDINDNQ